MRIYNQLIVETEEGAKFTLNIGDNVLVLTDGTYNEKKIIGRLDDIEVDDYLIVDGIEIPMNFVESIAKF